MHERTERAIARLLFVFCCAVPTLLTMLIILVGLTPWHHHRKLRALTRELTDDTGLIVSIEDFQRISPFKQTLFGIRLVDAETEGEVVRVREATWFSEDDRVGVMFHQPEFQSSKLARAWYLIHDRFLCDPERTSKPLELSANDLTIQSSTGPLTLRDVRAWVEPQNDAVRATIQCVPAMRDSGAPVTITIRRQRGHSPSTQWTLESGEHPLPCSALADWLPIMRSLGDESEFVGTLQWEVDHRGRWVIDLGGSRFTGVDLSRLCENLPHRLTGTADVHLERCFVDPGKTVHVSGSIRARQGWVGTSLLKALASHLGVTIDPTILQSASGDVAYQLSGIHFRISDSEMRFDGICGTERGYRLPPGVVMCTNNRPIAYTSEQTLPSLRLLRVLTPIHGELVPLSSQTQGWMDLLIAPNQPMPIDDGSLPRSRIKTAETYSGGELIYQR